VSGVASLVVRRDGGGRRPSRGSLVTNGSRVIPYVERLNSRTRLAHVAFHRLMRSEL
jgi:hypothetical protein